MSDEIANGGSEAAGLSSCSVTGGILTGPVSALVNMLAACPTFANEGTPLSRIFVQGAPPDVDRPFVIIFVPQGGIATKRDTGPYNAGTFQIMIEKDVSEADRDDHLAAFLSFAGFVEKVVQELWEQARGAGALDIATMDLDTIDRAGFTEADDYCQAVITITFGVT